jgi:hypothetical protein
MIYGATWKNLSMEKRPCSWGVGVYHCRCPQHSSRLRSTGFTLVIGESASGVPRVHEDLSVLQSMPWGKAIVITIWIEQVDEPIAVSAPVRGY